MKPRDAKKEKDLLKLTRDNWPSSGKGWSILVSEKHVTLFPPNNESLDYFSIPKKRFNEIIDWYNRNQ